MPQTLSVGDAMFFFVGKFCDSLAVSDVGFVGFFWDPLDTVLACSNLGVDDAMFAGSLCDLFDIFWFDPDVSGQLCGTLLLGDAPSESVCFKVEFSQGCL